MLKEMSTVDTTKLVPVRVNPLLVHDDERRASLDGAWQFCLDPKDAGVRGKWFDDDGALSETIEVPGSWQGQGFGDNGKERVWDFGLEARTFQAHYVGTAWYGKHFEIPADWVGRRIWLNFGGVHPSAEVWLNGVRVGENSAPFPPFGFDITQLARFGDTNFLAVRVHEENRLLGMAYSFQCKWSGLYRGVEITATGESYFEQFRAYPDVDKERISFNVRVGGLTSDKSPAKVRVSVRSLAAGSNELHFEAAVSSEELQFAIPVPSPDLWSPDKPNLYRIDAVLLRGDQVLDALSERTGFVKLSVNGKHFLINNQPYYMRGTGDFVSCPETGCPDTNRDRWRKRLTALRDYGYNYVRCQSYVYGPEYYDIADEVGLLIQSEMGMLGSWGGNTVEHTYAWPVPTPGIREAIKCQWDDVVIRDVNHPSANIYCMSNELTAPANARGVPTNFPRTAWKCYNDTKGLKPTAFVIWTDGGYHADLPGEFVNAEASTDAQTSLPVIQHEYRWWSSFPDVRAMGKYSGAARPYGAELALAAAQRHGIGHTLPLAAENSQHLQFIESKAKMEICRRDNPTLAGICHFNAMDFNLSPQVIIDEFYDRKLADSSTWLQTNGDTVIMSSLGFDDRVLSPGDTFKCDLNVSDYSHPPLNTPILEWNVTAGEQTLASGELQYAHEPFCTCSAGEISFVVPNVTAPIPARLHVTLTEGKRHFTNQWDLWIFPDVPDMWSSLRVYGTPEYTWAKHFEHAETLFPHGLSGEEEHVVIAERLDQTLVDFIHRGGRVILAASEGLVRPFNPKFGYVDGHYFFTPPANYPPYEDGHDGTIIADHPMLGQFFHEGFADFQFFRMTAYSPPIELEPLGLNQQDPVFRVMHSFPVGRSLGYLLEVRFGKGRLVLSAMDLNQTWPEARYFLAEIVKYLTREPAEPCAEVDSEIMRNLVRLTSLP
jgi:beta-galactosidase